MTTRHYLGIAEQGADGWSISFLLFQAPSPRAKHLRR